jgi:hypothetical protein
LKETALVKQTTLSFDTVQLCARRAHRQIELVSREQRNG